MSFRKLRHWLGMKPPDSGTDERHVPFYCTSPFARPETGSDTLTDSPALRIVAPLWPTTTTATGNHFQVLILTRSVFEPRLERGAQPFNRRFGLEPDTPFEIPIRARPLMMQQNVLRQDERLQM
jgi:hypothetical protein